MTEISHRGQAYEVVSQADIPDEPSYADPVTAHVVSKESSCVQVEDVAYKIFEIIETIDTIPMKIKKINIE